uniref:GtrA domain-containing protein n=1 Tax=Ascaris lumbricoides TaxID=6252 RepID=A0A0M3IJF1_ASCLU
MRSFEIFRHAFFFQFYGGNWKLQFKKIANVKSYSNFVSIEFFVFILSSIVDYLTNADHMNFFSSFVFSLFSSSLWKFFVFNHEKLKNLYLIYFKDNIWHIWHK